MIADAIGLDNGGDWEFGAAIAVPLAELGVAGKGEGAVGMDVSATEAKAATDKHATLMDAHAQLRETLRKKEGVLAEARGRGPTGMGPQ